MTDQDHDERREDRGFLAIGGLAKTIVNSQSPRDSIPTKSPRNFVTIGSQNPVARNSTGRRHIAIAAAKSPTNAMAEAFVAGDSYLVDKNLEASLRQCLGSALIARLDEDYDVIGYEPLQDVGAENLEAALTLVESCCQRATPAEISRELTRLRLSTKSRAESADDLVGRFQILTEECSLWPADMVFSTLRGLSRSEIFFPSLSVVRDRLQTTGRRRQSLLKRLSEALDVA